VDLHWVQLALGPVEQGHSGANERTLTHVRRVAQVGPQLEAGELGLLVAEGGGHVGSRAAEPRPP
jgi:hypothetical protein